MTKAFAGDLEYLEAELQWIEARCQRLGAQRKLEETRGSPPADPSPFGPSVAETPRQLQARLKRQSSEESTLRATIDDRLAASRAAGTPPALDRFCALYSLDAFERKLLLLAIAPAFSRGFDDLYAALTREEFSSGGPTVEAAFNFMEFGFGERILRRRVFGKASPLYANDLMATMGPMNGPEDLLQATVRVSTRTFSFLLGEAVLASDLLEFSRLEDPLASLDDVVVNPEDKKRILSVVERHDEYLRYRKEWGLDDVIRYGRGVLMLFYGPPGTGKTMMAHGVAARIGRRVLNVDIPTFMEHREANAFFPALFREARLQNAVLFFDECESLFAARTTGNNLLNVLLTEIERFEGVAILATNAPEQLDPALDRRALVRVSFPEPDRESRLRIWRQHLPARAPLADDVDLDTLASRFELTGGYIKNAVLAAVAEAVYDAGGAHVPRIHMRHLESAAQAQVRRTGQPGSPTRAPKVRLADVFLPAEQLDQVQEIVDAARNRRTVLDRWGIGSHLSFGKGVSALLCGPPGTGKTLCAEAIAGELHRPLLAASIPSVVSMWVGNTEKNIEGLFKEARALGAVLLLDEADALLAARGSGHASRHDDSAVDVLLVEIEKHDGVVLLATNLPDRLDPALDRRIGWKLTFALPTAELRAQIWRRLLPPTVPVEGTIDFDALGQRHALSGGQVKNAVLRAAFRAARRGLSVSEALLDEAAREEPGRPRSKPVGFGALPS